MSRVLCFSGFLAKMIEVFALFCPSPYPSVLYINNRGMEFELMEFLSPDKKDKKEKKEVEGLCSSFAAHWCSLSYIYVHV